MFFLLHWIGFFAALNRLHWIGLHFTELIRLHYWIDSEKKNEWIIWMNEKIASEYFKKIKILITTGNACLTYLEKKFTFEEKKITFIWNVLICISWCSFTSFLSLCIIQTIRLLVCLIEIQECRLQMQFLHRISLSIWVIIIWNVFNIRQFNRILNDDRKSDNEFFFFSSLFSKNLRYSIFLQALYLLFFLLKAIAQRYK